MNEQNPKIELRTPPKSTAVFDINGRPTMRLYYEEVDPSDFPEPHAGRDQWDELHKKLAKMEVNGKPIRLHFDTKKLAMNAQSAANGHAKRILAPYTAQTRLRTAENGGFWLYMRKIPKDPSLWGTRARKKRR